VLVAGWRDTSHLGLREAETGQKVFFFELLSNVIVLFFHVDARRAVVSTRALSHFGYEPVGERRQCSFHENYRSISD